MEKGRATKVSGSKERFRKVAKQAAEKHGVPYYVLDALIEKESQYNPKARSKKGAVGLTQLMPATAKILRVDPWNPEQNIHGGARFLADMLERFGDMEKALIAYNAGPSRVGNPPRSSIRYAREIIRKSQYNNPPLIGDVDYERPVEPMSFEDAPLAVGLRGFIK